MRYSDDLVEEIRMKNDIVDVISGYVKLTRRGSSYFGLCPFHNEKSPSFSVSPGKQMYYRFGGGAGGNVFTFLMEYENFTFVEALKFLADRAGGELPQMEYSKEAKEQADLKNTLLEINKQAAKHDRVIDVLLELHIAEEETKYGLTLEACRELLEAGEWREMKNVHISGLMMMASNVEDEDQIRREMLTAADFFDEVKARYFADDPRFCVRSWGMSHDYQIAVTCRSNQVRVGTAIFGPRVY